MTEAEAEALLSFQAFTGISPDPIDHRNMLDEETEYIAEQTSAMKQRLPVEKAREQAEKSLELWAKESTALGFALTLDSLTRFIASHRRPMLWAALVGYNGPFVGELLIDPE
jgi:hypothetical protein